MADISSYQHKFRATSKSVKPDNSGKVRKRNRAAVSCLQCRNKKSKCDREQPCGSCKVHGTTCTYGKSDVKRPSKISPQDRLNHLEDLLLEMIQAKDQNNVQLPVGRTPSQLASPEDSASSIEISTGSPGSGQALRGSYRQSETEESYVGPTHWQAILETIHGLKSELEAKESSGNIWAGTSDKKAFQSESLFYTQRPPSLAHILRALPDRPVADRILSFYFKSKFFSVPLVHVGQFHRLYEKFWGKPHDMPVLWIAQLFSIFSISTVLKDTTGAFNGKSKHWSDEILQSRGAFTTAAAQCLVLADYTKPQKFLIEALFLYCQSKGMASFDPAGETWLLFALMTRQALRLGYHRDPKHFPHISVFDGEMRRRTWFMITEFDSLTAFQLGLPANLHTDDEWDTAHPRSLHDFDFDESTIELPANRSELDPTLIQFFTAKANIMKVQKKLLHQQFTSRSISYDNDVLRLDAELEHVHNNTPEALKFKSMSQSFSDPGWLVMYRYTCNVVYLKAICVLHRNYITAVPRRQYSIDRCAQAGMQVLTHQETIYNESKPGGQLSRDLWFSKSLHLSNCLLAAVILCQVILLTNEEECNADTRTEIIRLLRTTLDITEHMKEESREAARFNSALELILKKVEPSRASDETSQATATNSAPAQSRPAAPTLIANGTPSVRSEFDGLFNGSDDINWSIIDQGLMGVASPNIEIDWDEFDMSCLNGDGNSTMEQTLGVHR